MYLHPVMLLRLAIVLVGAFGALPAVQEGTRIESPGELHIGSCQVIWQTELVSAPPAAGALGAVSPSGGESKRLVNTPVAGASNCSVAVEVERKRATDP